MGGQRIITCWNCETCSPAAAHVGQRCPLCGAKNHLHPLYLVVAIAFLGVLIGYVGGAGFGLIGQAIGSHLDPETSASTGALLVGSLFSLVGVVVGTLVVLDNRAAGCDGELLIRGAEVKRERLREAAARFRR